MKKFISIALLLMVTLAQSSQVWDEAFARAKKEHKNVMVVVHEDYCKWCKKMETQTLPDAKIQKKLEKYVILELKRSDRDSVKNLKTFSGAIPSFYFFNANQLLIDEVIGYFDVEDFLGYLTDLEEGV